MDTNTLSNCTLWNNNFDPNEVTSIGVRAVDDHEVYPSARYYQARITLGQETWVFAPKQHVEYKDAHCDMQEAIVIIAKAIELAHLNYRQLQRKVV